VKFLRDNKKTFVVRHGTYTTTIETEHGKNKYETHQFNNRVFIAAAMIRKDVVNSVVGKQIMEADHEKINFGHHQKLEPFNAKEVLNIDISGAYASCLYVNGLITDNTFKYLKRLRKEERLPSVGMLAKSACLWKYENGECVDIVVERSKTAQVFFYLIEEINYVMRGIQWELGKHFYFYWVDGVFFSKDTPKHLITNVENLLINKGYQFKYEEVTNFKLSKSKKVALGIISSGFTEHMVQDRAVLLGIEHVYVGREPKLDILKTWCVNLGYSLDEVAIIGDDLNDLPVMQAVGLAVCPASAVSKVKSAADIILSRKGGDACVREFIDNYLL